MYLATGAPRVFSARDESLSDALNGPALGIRGILGLEPLPGSRLFATFTSHAMYLWSTRVRSCRAFRAQAYRDTQHNHLLDAAGRHAQQD